MQKVGLTGGIASGKSTVLGFFSECGADVFDADLVARELTKPNTEYTAKIIEYFGEGFRQVSGELDRKKLANIVFSQPGKRAWLNALLHPAVWQVLQAQINASKAPYCVTAIPLLVESKNTYPLDRICVIDIDHEKQIRYAIARDNKTAAEVEKIIDAQATSEQRLAVADDVVYNDSDIAALKSQVNLLHQKYLKMK